LFRAKPTREVPVSIGERVRAGRKALNLSQEEVARRAGVSLNQVNRLERGEIVDPHYSTLAGLATALDMQISELVGEPAAPLVETPQEPGQAETPKGPGPVHHVRMPHDSIEVSDEVKVDVRLQKVRQILDAWEAGKIGAVHADNAIQREYPAAS
jgi:DNA-binding XRE family transcriptional regulator